MKKKQNNQQTIVKILISCIVLAVLIFSASIALINHSRNNDDVTSNVKLSQSSETSLSSQISQAETETLQESTTTSLSEETTSKKVIDNKITSSSSEQTTITPQSQTAVSVLERVSENSNINSETGRIVVDTDREDWYFIVVNSSREMPEGYVPKLKEILGCGKTLDYRVAPYYEEMYYAAKKDGITLTPYSAYRSYDRQKTNYDNLTNTYMSRYNISKQEARKKAATVILPPGTSEHNLGLAMDICNTYDSFANTKEYAWLVEHAHEYGFILRYTAEKQSITGIVPEPWHWRYVGKEYAKEIKDSGLCLEEWLDSKGIAY